MGTIHRVVVGALVLAATGAAVAREAPFNASAGGPLRPGIYGRVEVHGAPPPLISPDPVVARRSIGPIKGEPLYFYLPAGQVRKWAQYCQRYAACERPVYFVRMDEAPGKLGRWKAREHTVRDRDATTLAGVIGL